MKVRNQPHIWRITYSRPFKIFTKQRIAIDSYGIVDSDIRMMYVSFSRHPASQSYADEEAR